MVEFEIVPGTNIIEFVVDGGLTKEELAPLLAACDEVIAEHGKARLLKQVRSLGSVEAGAIWENMKWGFSNLKNLERVAAVGDKAWMERVTKMADPLFKAELRFFLTEQIDEARAWLREA
jgi:hypothetical protein